MAYTIPTIEPTVLNAGDSWQWDRTYSNFRPDDGWTLTYAFGGPGKARDIVAAAASSGASYEIRVLPAITELVDPGVYDFVGRVDDGTDTHTVFQNTVRVVANIDLISQTTNADQAELEILEAAIRSRLTDDVQVYTINGRSLTRVPIETLYKMRGYARSRVAAASDPGGFGREHKVSFSAAS